MKSWTMKIGAKNEKGVMEKVGYSHRERLS